MSTYRDLWRSGSILREAATCRTVTELAARLGVTADGLSRALYTLRQQGEAIPLLKDLLGVPFQYPVQDEEDWDDKTSPGMSLPVHEGEAAVNVRVGEDIGKADISRLPGEPIHMETDVPEGFRVKGLSTYYDADGKVTAQWVKADRSADDRMAALMKALATLAEPFEGLHAPIAPATDFDEDLLTIYPFGDPHIGMQAWAEECGEDFDVKIAERDIVAAVDHLVDLAPPSHTAILVPLGDNFHVDGEGGGTTAGTPQDVDTRLSKVFGILVRTFRRCIDRALEKHQRVIVFVLRGNHDWHMSLALAYTLAGYYSNEPRVEIDPSPAAHRWFRFGKCMFGFTHGDKTKREDLPSIMACDRAEDWGQTVYRKVLVGHVHHDTVKEMRGCTVQSYRTLAPKDKYHTAHGYRSMQDMRAEVWHREWGQVNAHSVGIAQIRKRAKAA